MWGPKRPRKRAETARCHFSWSRSQPKMFQTLKKHSSMMASVDSRAFLQKLEQCPWLGPKRPPKRAETARCHFSWSRRQPKMFQTLRKQSPMMASVDSRAFLQMLEPCPWSGKKRPPKSAETARCHFYWSRSQPKMFQTLRKHSPMMASVDSRAFL